MNLEGMRSERSQSQKTTDLGFHLYEMSRKSKYIETESKLMVAWGLE